MTESVIYAAVFLGVILGCCALFDFSHNILLTFQDVVGNQGLAHQEKKT